MRENSTLFQSEECLGSNAKFKLLYQTDMILFSHNHDV